MWRVAAHDKTSAVIKIVIEAVGANSRRAPRKAVAMLP